LAWILYNSARTKPAEIFKKEQENKMCNKQIILMLLGVVAGSSIFAQDDGGELPNPCTIEPIFHCAEPMGDGGTIGHFGYRVSCPESDKPAEDIYVAIGDDNYFAPGPIDRGQPTVFVLGEHVDEFETEFTAEDIKKGKGSSWTVLKIGARIDFSKTKDATLDCNKLPY